jgi:hypothetical protein
MQWKAAGVRGRLTARKTICLLDQTEVQRADYSVLLIDCA